MEKTFVTAGIIITALTALAFSQHKQISTKNIPVLQSTQIAYTENKKDTVPQEINGADNDDSKYTINSTMHGKQYKVVEINGKVTELYVDNVKIPDDKISDYSDIIQELKKNIETAKQNQHRAMKAQTEKLKAQVKAMDANKLAVDAQVKANIQNMQVQQKELQKEMIRAKIENDSGKSQRRVEALKAETEVLQQKVLAMSDLKNDAVKIKLEALEAEQAYMHEHAAKLTQVTKEIEPVKAKTEKLAVIAKEQALIHDQSKKQSKTIKEKTEKIIDVELKKQIEQLKEQNEELKQQLRERTDSIHVTPALPQGA